MKGTIYKMLAQLRQINKLLGARKPEIATRGSGCQKPEDLQL
jgi:hypothetical protein